MLKLPDGARLTVAEVRDAASRFVQALRRLGVGAHTRVGLLSTDRPEVLHGANAAQLLPAIYAPMHPLSGLADHRYEIRDAKIDLLIFDAKRYSERAAELAEQVPGLRRVAFGESPLGEKLCKLAQCFTPAPLVAPRVGPHDLQRLGYSEGTTGKPKALASVHRTSVTTHTIMMAQ